MGWLHGAFVSLLCYCFQLRSDRHQEFIACSRSFSRHRRNGKGTPMSSLLLLSLYRPC